MKKENKIIGKINFYEDYGWYEAAGDLSLEEGMIKRAIENYKLANIQLRAENFNPKKLENLLKIVYFPAKKRKKKIFRKFFPKKYIVPGDKIAKNYDFNYIRINKNLLNKTTIKN